MERVSSIGTRVPSVEGIQKVTGRCTYTFDIDLPGMLVGRALYPEYPRARITRLDTSKAQSIPGVVAIATHADIPGEKKFGPLAQDQPVFAIDEVFHIGDVVAAVAAANADVAEEALAALKIELVRTRPPTTDG